MKQNKILSLAGLAMKAGKVVSGEFSTEKAVKSGHARLALVAGDASDNTKKMFTNMCAYYKVPVCFYSDKETLGAAIGKPYRASLAVTDEGFAKAIRKAITKETDLEEAFRISPEDVPEASEGETDENGNGGSKYGKNQSQ